MAVVVSCWFARVTDYEYYYYITINISIIVLSSSDYSSI